MDGTYPEMLHIWRWEEFTFQYKVQSSQVIDETCSGMGKLDVVVKFSFRHVMLKLLSNQNV